MVCEYLRDCDPSIGFSEASYSERTNQRITGILPLRPDVRFPNQWLFDVVDGKLQYEISGFLQPVLVNHHVPGARLQDSYVMSRIQNISMEIKASKSSTFRSLASGKGRKKKKRKMKEEENDTLGTGNKKDDKSVIFSSSKHAKIELSSNHRKLRSSLGFTVVDLLGASRNNGTYSNINQIPTIFSCLGYSGSTPEKKKLKVISIKDK